MEVIQTNIPGVLIIEPRVFKDSRGYFFESFSQREFDEKVTPILGHRINFVQDNESMSAYGVMRGLHYQRMPYTQSKLVRCVKGAVLDVAVDIRKGSSTFGQHVSCLLTGRDEEGMKIAEQFAKESVISNQSSLIGLQFFIPRGFAVLSETAVFQYKCDNFYHPEADGGINIKNEILYWIGNKSVTIDAFHYFKKYASYALTVNTLENNQNYHKLWIINLSQ